VLTTIGDDLNLVTERGVDKLNQIDTGKAIDKTKVEVVELQATEIQNAKDTSLADTEEGVKRLQLEQGVDVEDLGVEEALEDEHIKVVLDLQVLEELQVESIETLEIAQVDLIKLQAVEAACIEDGTGGERVGGCLHSAGLGCRGSGDSGDSGNKARKDGRELHVDWGCGLGMCSL
jgi:hypothetical protein